MFYVMFTLLVTYFKLNAAFILTFCSLDKIEMGQHKQKQNCWDTYIFVQLKIIIFVL